MRLTPFLFLLLALACAAEETVLPREKLTGMKSYDVGQLAAQAGVLSGEIVKVKFGYRLPLVEPGENGALKGTIGFTALNVTTGATHGGTIAVVVPKEARDWFMKVPADTDSKKLYYVYAKLRMNETVPEAELLGREIKTDTKGSKVVWDLSSKH